ncbi:MAG: hypothetical protein M1830_007930 [Pleopsidium flavum]|nr:MAG: hypothetical protein M1830_007930 [Pleopsidium flavum]
MAGGQKRIGKELAEITREPPEGVTASLVSESDVYKWRIVLEGPVNSPYAVRNYADHLKALTNTSYQGGRFNLLLTLPTEYPFKPPTLSFQTKIYHPNVSNDDKGSMCLGMLRSDEWKPSSKISAVLKFARQILAEPMPDDAVEMTIADQYKNDRKEFDKTAKNWVKTYASKK